MAAFMLWPLVAGFLHLAEPSPEPLTPGQPSLALYAVPISGPADYGCLVQNPIAEGITCSDYPADRLATGQRYKIFVVLVGNGPEAMIGAHFSIEYNRGIATGLAIESWESCVDHEIRSLSWPASGSSIIVDTIDNCQAGDLVLGYFIAKVDSAAYFRIIPPPGKYEPVGIGCYSKEVGLYSRLPFLGFGEIGGINPCSAIDWCLNGCPFCCRGERCERTYRLEDYLFCRIDGFLPVSSCEACATPADHVSWGLLKSRYGSED